MIKKVIIILNDDEFYDDAQLLARSFFARASVERVKEERKESGFVPQKTVEISSDGETVYLRLDGLVPSVGSMSLTRGQIHDIFKRAMYKDISASTGITLPWGFLTGVKPAKRITEILKKNPNIDEETARRKFEAAYMVRPDKSRLAYEVAKNEEKILTALHKERDFSIYLGIPFCPSVCSYCSFGSLPVNSVSEADIESYIDALCYEIKEVARMTRDKYSGLGAVYIGGGTPITLGEPHLERVFDTLVSEFGVENALEFTVEAGRPDAFTKAKLKLLKEKGVTRISVNPQSMNEATLKRIGRNHTTEDVRDAFKLARDLGFDNINTDIILALPGEGPKEVAETAEEIRALAPESLTVHSLAIKRAAAMDNKSLPSDLTAEDMEKMTAETVRLADELEMQPYYMYRQQNMAGNLENVGYAKEGRECLYNIVIMEEVQDIIALGCGASSKFIFDDGRIERAVNVKSLKDYIERTDEMIERKRRLL